MAGTLPHRKYYNLEAYEKYKEAKAASKGIKKSTKKVRAQRAALVCVDACGKGELPVEFGIRLLAVGCKVQAGGAGLD